MLHKLLFHPVVSKSTKPTMNLLCLLILCIIFTHSAATAFCKPDIWWFRSQDGPVWRGEKVEMKCKYDARKHCHCNNSIFSVLPSILKEYEEMCDKIGNQWTNKNKLLSFPVIVNVSPNCPTTIPIIVFSHSRCCKNCSSTLLCPSAPKPTMNPSWS